MAKVLEHPLPEPGACGESSPLDLDGSRKVRLTVPVIPGLKKPSHIAIQSLRGANWYGIPGASARVNPGVALKAEFQLPKDVSTVRILTFTETEAGDFEATAKLEVI